MSESLHGIHYHLDSDGIVTITMDMAGHVNKLDEDFREALAWFTGKLAAQPNLGGVVLSSAKSTFFAGGDIGQMKDARPGDEPYWIDFTNALKQQMRRLEKLPVPVVAAINGAALGGGMELCLSCNRRIAWDSPKVQLGLPEVTLGILPGGGGVVRSIRLLGLEKALPLLLEGTRLSAAEALEIGWIDATVSHPDDLVPEAKAWIKSHPTHCKQPWDMNDDIPGGGIGDANNRKILDSARATHRHKSRGLLPAPLKIIEVAGDVLCLDFDRALEAETLGSIDLMMTPACKNLMASTFVQTAQVRRGPGRPKNIGRRAVSNVSLVGSGPLAQTIAPLCSRRGIRCQEITPADIADSDSEIVVVSTSGWPGAKPELLGVSASKIAGDRVLVIGTSVVPVSSLGQSLARCEQIVGLNIQRLPGGNSVAEIVATGSTCPEALALGWDFVNQLGLTAIVVDDSPGFYLSRLQCSYLNELARLRSEGCHPSALAEAAWRIGMEETPEECRRRCRPMLEEVARLRSFPNLNLPFSIAAVSAEPPAGSASGATSAALPQRDIGDRLLFRQSVEAFQCLEEGVVQSVAEANIGSLKGAGAPVWTGGFIQFANSYGLAPFVARCAELAQTYGDRFLPAKVIGEKLKAGDYFE